jgi:hypothetical protein
MNESNTLVHLISQTVMGLFSNLVATHGGSLKP